MKHPSSRRYSCDGSCSPSIPACGIPTKPTWPLPWLFAGPMSTGAVCYEIVKPATRAAACAYTTLLWESRKPGGPAPVSTATVFLSHAWSNPFLSLVAAAEAHLLTTFGQEDAEEQFVWCALMERPLLLVARR